MIAPLPTACIFNSRPSRYSVETTWIRTSDGRIRVIAVSTTARTLAGNSSPKAFGPATVHQHKNNKPIKGVLIAPRHLEVVSIKHGVVGKTDWEASFESGASSVGCVASY